MGEGYVAPHVSLRVGIEPRAWSLTTGPEAQPSPLLGKLLTSSCLSFLICQTRRTTGSWHMSRGPLRCTQARWAGNGSKCPGHSCGPFPGLTEVYMRAQSPGQGTPQAPCCSASSSCSRGLGAEAEPQLRGQLHREPQFPYRCCDPTGDRLVVPDAALAPHRC